MSNQMENKYVSNFVTMRDSCHFDEMIIPGENGCSGGNIPISHFLLSLTHSALSFRKNGNTCQLLHYPRD